MPAKFAYTNLIYPCYDNTAYVLLVHLSVLVVKITLSRMESERIFSRFLISFYIQRFPHIEKIFIRNK